MYVRVLVLACCVSGVAWAEVRIGYGQQPNLTKAETAARDQADKAIQPEVSAGAAHVWTLDYDNRLSPRWLFERLQPPGPQEILRWAEDDEYAELLSMTPQQRRQITDFDRELRSVLVEYDRLAVRMKHDEEVAGNLDWLAEGRRLVIRKNELLELIDSELLPHQQDYVTILFSRRLATGAGLDVALHGLLGESLRLTDRQRARIASRLQPIRDSLSAAAGRQAQRHIDEVSAVLTPEQREQVALRLEPLIELQNSSFELRAWQLQNLSAEQQRFADVYQQWLQSPLTWEVEFTGELQPAGQHRFGPSVRDLLQLAESGAYGAIAAVDTQLSDWSETDSEFLRIERQYAAGLQEIDAMYELRQISAKEWGRRHAEAALERNMRLIEYRLQVLLPWQREELQRVLLRRLIGQLGLHHSLYCGQLGRTLDLDDQQKQRVWEIAQRHREEVVDESRYWEREVWRAVSAELDAEQRRRLPASLLNVESPLVPVPTFLMHSEN